MKKFKAISLISTLTVCYLLFAGYSHAQSQIKLTVSPPNQEINVKPGMETRIQVKFFNASTESVAGFIKTADFIVSDKQGGPDLIYVPPENNRYSAASWMTPLESQVNIAPNAPYTATIMVNVPQDVTGCGHYAAVYFEPAPAGLGDKQSVSQVSFKLTGLVYFMVEGKCTEKAYLNKINASKFLEYGPIPVTVEVLNRSDYHITPQGNLQLVDLFNKESVVETLPKYNIFPDAVRQYDLELGSKWMLGRYKIAISANYGKTGQAINGFTYVWVFPWRVALIIILSLIITIFIGNNFYKRIITKESVLEGEIQKEKEEIEKLKKQLRKNRE